MKKILVGNYWLIIVSWCLFLNGMELLAIILSLSTTVYLLLRKSEVDVWRICAISLMMFMLGIMILISTNILYFFPKLNILFTIMCLNSATVHEHLYKLRKESIMPMMLLAMISVAVLSFLIVILPEELYTIFGKRSLFLMEVLIFLPYLIPMLYVYAYKSIKNSLYIAYRKKGAVN